MTSPYSRILCPVDFSDVSRCALEWSLEFAARVDGTLSVVHALDTSMLNVGNLVAVPDGSSQLRATAQRQLDEWKSELDLSRADCALASGTPADVIEAAAAVGDVDLVVMGTHGFSGLSKLLLGSVTEKVLHRVRVPMMALRPRTADVGATREPTTILVAIDFGPETKAVVAHGAFLAELYGAQLVAAHVVPVPYVVLNDKTLERLSDDQMSELMRTLASDHRDALTRILDDTGSLDVDIVTRVGGVHPVLNEIIESRNIDLVITGAGGHRARGLGWVGSTCHKLVRSAPCPVLIVH